MSNARGPWFVGCLVLASAAMGQTSIPVSPGSVDGRSAAAGSPCPTFSWSAVAGASGYELVVYEVPEGAGVRSAAAAEPQAEPVIRRRIPGAALSWTPPNGSCLELARDYLWSVRALGEAGPGPWSRGALFRVEPDRTLRAVAEVIERALAGYLEERAVAFAPDGGLAAILAREIASPEAPAAAAAAPAAAEEPIRLARGGTLRPGEPLPKAVVLDEVELWLHESGATMGDYLQLVLSTPDYDGHPQNVGDAWSLSVVAETGSPATGRIFLSSPIGFDAFQADPGTGRLRVGDLELPSVVRLIPRTISDRPLCGAAIPDDEGRLYYEDTTNSLCVCDGTSWKKVDGGAAC